MANKYHEFFKESPDGEHFMSQLEDLILNYHRDSEKNPDKARDNSQKACGIRDVMLMINTMSTSSKKGRSTKYKRYADGKYVGEVEVEDDIVD